MTEDYLLSKEDREAQQELDRAFFICFNTKSGKIVLEHLKNISVDRIVAEPNSTQIEVGIRQGFCNAYFYIQQRIKENENG